MRVHQRAQALVMAVGLVLTTSVTSVAAEPGSRTGESGDQNPTASASKATWFRTVFGLDASPETVAASLGDSKTYPDTSMGVPLTLAEAKEMERRAKVQEDVDVAIETLSTRNDWAGVFLDQARGGMPVFQTTSDTGAFDRAVESVLPGTDHEVRVVAHSRSQLEDLKDEIAKSFDELRAQGIDVHSVGVKVSQNAVLVGVRDLGEGASRMLEDRFGDLVVAREDPVRELDACIDRIECPPLKGGIKIYRTSNTSAICTSGFIVKLQGTSTLRVLTAGHCIELNGGLGVGWSHHGSQFGTAQTETWGNLSNADAGLISLGSLSGDKNLVFASSASDVRNIVSWTHAADQNEGDVVCRSGKTSGYWCGYIEAEDLTMDVDGKDIEHQWEVNYDASPGDSGGSMIFGGSALGIHSDSTAADPPGGHGWYSPIGWVFNKLTSYGTPITLCTTAAC